MNLITNAWHSMTESEKKNLTITCSEIDHFVEFIVEDTGCGISKIELPKIFDPFFGNKGIYAEAGSAQSNFDAKGLGLSICQTIMEKHHNGKIEIESEVGSGTKVKLLIPKATSEKIDSLPLGKNFKILILDIKLDVGSTCKRIFNLCDYITIETESINELIKLIRKGWGDILVIDKETLCSVDMVSFLSSQEHKLPVIVLSDQKETQILNEKELGVKSVCYKPYLFKTLIWTIWDELA